MQATIGDRICIHGNVVGHPDKNGEIVEVRGSQGEPPYMVRFDDGHTRLIFPGPDAVIEHPESTLDRFGAVAPRPVRKNENLFYRTSRGARAGPGGT